MKQLIFAAVLAIAFAGFGWTMMRYVRVLLRGVPDPRPRFDQIPKRLAMFVIYFLGQKKVAEGQIKPAMKSWHHLIIFWGFLVITIGTIELIVRGLFPSFRLSLLIGDTLYGGLKAVTDVLDLLVLLMVLYAYFRRIVIKPRLIPINLDAALILGLIGGLMVTYFFSEAFHAVVDWHAAVAYAAQGGAAAPALPIVTGAPLSTLLAGWLSGTDAATAHTAGEAFYWGHVGILLFFLNYIPYSKHIHLLGALPNIVTMNLSQRLMDLPKLDLEDENQWGVGKYEQFSWKSLLDTYACTECARCSNYCPANATDKPLSPMQLIHDIRYEMLERGTLELELARLQDLIDTSDTFERPRFAAEAEALRQKIAALPPMVGGRIKEETLWACTTCGACQEACPVFIEHPLKIIQMRQNLVLAQEKTPPDLARAFRNIERAQNPWGIGADQRMDWAEGLDVPTIDDKPNPEYLLWVGCAGAFDQRIRKQTQAMVNILNSAGVDYAVLGHKESCTGDPARRGGNEMLFQMQAEMNVETLNGAGVKKVITSCPHCLHTLRHDYPQFGGHYELIHHTQLLEHLVATGRIKPANGDGGKVVYHDSCYLGRWNGEYEAPREILRRLPMVDVVEPGRARNRGFCCGAGGGRMFMEEKIGTRVNVNRAEELVATGAKTVAVACPFCNVMMTDGMKHLNKEEEVRVMDIAELLNESIKPRPGGSQTG
jgi:Fe-S oxidoreductase